MGVAAVGRRHQRFQLQLDLERGLARRHSGAVADAKHMGVDGEGLLAERDVEDDIGGLAADARAASPAPRARAAPALPCSAMSFCDSAMTFFALVLNRPMVLMASRSFASPSATIFSGVSTCANKARVALLTPASVACADSTTATSSV